MFARVSLTKNSPKNFRREEWAKNVFANTGSVGPLVAVIATQGEKMNKKEEKNNHKKPIGFNIFCSQTRFYVNTPI